jgi:Rps23 Pro-64 3,4-dihydroxylase Tpa1-like proline 4-hydroxylase
MQMQRYIDDQGYYAWHHENEGGTTAKRELFFIYYLNDVDNGGETEFKFNPKKVKPEAGKLVIAPALWTHKHRGNPPQNGQYKYIITGWIEKKDEHYISEEFEEDYLI